MQGYIVDAFGEIRAEENDRENDSGNNCLVCSLSKFELQRHGAEFEAHVDRHHNRWCVSSTDVYSAPRFYGDTVTDSVVCCCGNPLL